MERSSCAGERGTKDRTTYLNERAISRVKAWLDVRGKSPGALLCPIRRGGHIQDGHLSSQSVLLVLQKRSCTVASIIPVPVFKQQFSLPSSPYLPKTVKQLDISLTLSVHPWYVNINQMKMCKKFTVYSYSNKNNACQ
jgi:hypothetical protein